jgi:two-component system, LytTR family, sensor kinase
MQPASELGQSVHCTEQAIRCIVGLSSSPWNTILLMDDARIPAKSQLGLWIVAIWFAVGLFDATQTVVIMHAEGMQHAWVRLFMTLLFSWLPWALATPIVLALGRRYVPSRWKSFSTWLVHLSACAIIGGIAAAWNVFLTDWLNPYSRAPNSDSFVKLWSDRFYAGLLSYSILYGTILLVSHMLDARERLSIQRTETARLNEQLSKAQLNALRRQIEPHFLFNTLNAIAGLVREERKDAAVTMIAGLSDFLRHVVNDSDRQQVSLKEELDFTQKYLDIQKVRFAERLQFSVAVPGDLLPAQVPSLLLQPMVENAIKHGIAKRVQGGAIRITASQSHGRLTLNVYNDGPTLAEDWNKSPSGIGISNMRTRLAGLYGDAFELNMKDQEPGGVEISVSLPFKE